MRTLLVRLDSIGDVLVTGPAARAAARHSDHVTLLAGPRGAEAARLLPGVDDVLVWRCPWIDPEPPPVTAPDVAALVDMLAEREFERALIFTSYHQSPLPTALALRLAGVPWVGAISVDYPGSLLDLRHRVPDDIPEPERALSLCHAAGLHPAPDDDGRLRVSPGSAPELVPADRYVVLHPGTSVPARAWPAARFAEAARLLTSEGRAVVVTGAASERGLTAYVAGDCAIDLGGRTDLAQLAAVIAGADAIVVGNTGPAHLAAAVGTPVVSLYAPTIPAVRWAPYRVPCVLLGDQQAACRDTRATECPVADHPCLASVTADEVVRAVEKAPDAGWLSFGASDRPAGEAAGDQTRGNPGSPIDEGVGQQ